MISSFRHTTIWFALVWLTSFGCAPQPGAPIAVSIGYGHPDPNDTTWQWSNASTDFRVDNIAWNNAVVELHLCESWELSSLLIPSAHAHVSSSTTRLGVPMLEVFTEPIVGLRVVGELAPDPGTFCRGFLIVAPADDDVMNLSNIETESMLGKTFRMDGAFRNAADAEWTPFSISTDQFFAFEFPLNDPVAGTPKITTDAGNTVIVGIDKSVPNLATMIDSPDILNDPQLPDRIVRAIGETVSMRTF